MMATDNELARLLIVEDETPMRKFLRAFLDGAGYCVEEAGTGADALRVAVEHIPHLVILDLGLPDMDGQELIVQLRGWCQAPIIVLTVRNQDAQKVAALDSGADDYLTKPFSTTELMARIRVALRHATKANAAATPPVFETGNLKIDLSARRVMVRGKEVHLTPIEYKLLQTLVQNAGKVVSHQHLLKEAWGDEVQDTQHLRVFMGTLRRKVELNLRSPDMC